MKKLKYDYVVGTGGLGTGILFRFFDNDTLGRNESRLAELSDVRDFCKLHIILHYVAVYTEKKVPIYAIGKVGNDGRGCEVIRLMKEQGINCDYVTVDETRKTMYSVCYVYPDGAGGNITTSNSASGNVAAEDVKAFFKEQKPGKRGLVLAAPEVGLEVRKALLKNGRKHHCYNVASFASDEMKDCLAEGIFADVDLLAINEDEMEALLRATEGSAEKSGEECYRRLCEIQKDMQLIITRGGEGAQFFAGGHSEKSPAIWKPVNSTAGAGDCFLATVLSGLICGVPFFDAEGKVGLGGLAALAASLKVTCKDTIDFCLNRKRLWEEANSLKIEFSEKINRLYFGDMNTY